MTRETVDKYANMVSLGNQPLKNISTSLKRDYAVGSLDERTYMLANVATLCD